MGDQFDDVKVHRSWLMSCQFVAATYFLFYGSGLLVLYSVLTFNVYLLAFLITMSLIQIPIGRWPWFAKFVAKYTHPSRFFKQFTFIKDTDEPAKTQKCVYAFHPHSVYAAGLLCSMNNPDSPDYYDMVGIGSNFVLNTPIIGLLFRIWGVSSASNINIKSLMAKGKKIGLLPGGFEEATVTSREEIRCWVSRKGFVKYSLEYDYDIVPVLVLGQHQGFWVLKGLKKWRLMLNRIKVPGTIFTSWLGPILPPSVEFTVIRGKCIKAPKKPAKEASKQQIDDIHRQYVEQIERLHSKYKHLNGNKPLRFI